jgi:membrane-associated protein
MEFLRNLVDLFLHLDRHLSNVAGDMGPWLYLVLFAVIFCETGLVVTPILPGDSLLFAIGALAASSQSRLVAPFEPIAFLAVLLIVAAVAGDAVNYWIGYLIGPRVFQREDSWLLNKRHLMRAHSFYERHGGKTIVLARFMPIIRTFAPFVAGVGRMQYRRFWVFNFTGGVAWVLLFLLGGYYFGTTPLVQKHFHLVIVAVVFLSVLPIGIEWFRARRQARAEAEEKLVPVEAK